jgi:predicted NAD/FAD-dependent oxidoreductase
MSRIAIVGAGVAGLSAAWSLRTIPAEVTVFEKSRGYAGRAATRGRYGVRYDHGANFIQPTSDRVAHLLTEALPTDDLVDIDRAVWTFTGDGEIQPNDGDNGDPKWTYRNGINTVGKLLAREASAIIHTETHVQRLEAGDDTWTVVSDENESFGPFDAVVLTPPAPQTAAILSASSLAPLVDDAMARDFLDAVEAAEYAAQFTVVLAYERRIKRAGDFYGLLSDDREHPIAWIGFEHDKPGHVPQGHSVVVVQMSPAWTSTRVDVDPDHFMPDVKDMAADVLDADLKRPSWYDTQRWRYSLPHSQAEVEVLKRGSDAGLFFAGDYVAGEGRVGRAIESGLEVAEQVKQREGS